MYKFPRIPLYSAVGNRFPRNFPKGSGSACQDRDPEPYAIDLRGRLCGPALSWIRWVSMLIFQKMLTLFLLMMVGYFFRKKDWINDSNSGLLSKIVINVANPAMMIAAGMDSETTLSNETLLGTFLMAVIFYIVLVASAPLVARILRIPADRRGTYQFMYVFGNIGFMGMPLISSVFGSEYALLVALFNFVFNVLVYTYGIELFRREAARNAGAAADKSASGAGLSENLKKLVNAGTIGCLVAMICFLTKVPVPDFLYSAFEMCSNLACPLSMIVIGASLAAIAPKDLISDMQLNVFILVRMIAIPLISIAFVKYLIAPGELLERVFYVMISVPFASTSVMMAQEYGGRKDAAAKGVAFSTLVSVITIPLVGMLMGF